jgi:energy-coupling factor transporter ATP-binding protein EcfA2
MRISAISVHGTAGWPGVSLETHSHGLIAICGPSNSGKSTIAGLMGHALFGRREAGTADATLPQGELIVEGDGGRYRLRRVRDAQGVARLTVAALDGTAVDRQTTRRLVGNLPPSVLAPLCAVSFREPPNLGQLLSKEFALGFQAIQSNHDDGGPQASRRAAELAARRDLLAQELETRIAGERRASGELESRWRELDRQAREQQQSLSVLEQRLQSCEKSLAETDARLRYRRLELNVELRWRADECQEPETPLTELDTQIECCRRSLAEIAAREGVVRSRLSHVQTARSGTALIADQQTWLAVSRQLAADLSGEVSRLARASASQNCVCRDAHPRLRPIAETIERQLAMLEGCIQDQRRTLTATELQGEIGGLVRTQTELRSHLEHLLARRQAHTFGARRVREVSQGTIVGFSAADAEILESRRLELEQERFGLAEQVSAAAERLTMLRAEREDVERQRAALLSVRSIEHVQRELAVVQQKLEQATGTAIGGEAGMIAADHPARASDFLAQLTSGDLVRLVLTNQGRRASIIHRDGATIAVEQLNGTQRDQVYLSLCLTLLSAASRKGVWLPLVLDEPFERLDVRGTAALVAVLDVFARQGHQVFVFTRKQEATVRLASVGAAVHNIASLRRWGAEPAAELALPPMPPDAAAGAQERKIGVQSTEVRSTEYPAPRPRRRKKKPVDRSDAA